MGLSGHWMLVNIISSEHASEYYVECSSRISEIPPLECWEHSRNLVLQCLHLAPVGKEQIGQHGMFRLSLAPSFVNDDSGTAELIYSTVQAYHEVSAWSQATLCGRKVWVTRGENTATAAVSARREFVRLWCVTSAALAAAPALESEDVSRLRTCSSSLAYPGFSQQCGQREDPYYWHHEQSEEQFSTCVCSFSFEELHEESCF